MSRFRNKFVAAFLVAFWLLATQHCGLEAAGLLASHAEESQACCASDESHCSHDGCRVVEGGDYNPGAPTKVSLPQLADFCGLICARASEPVREIVPRGASPHFDPPQDWVSTWQFVQRAALSPRAPSLV